MPGDLTTGPGGALVSKTPCGACPAPDQAVAGLLDQKILIQDFTPLEESLDWQLGQLYYRQRGHHAFLSGEVPYAIHNDGYVSQHAAELLFTSLIAAERHAPLPEKIHILELGAGIGLFARLLLDAFYELCGRHRKDYYHRLCFHITDGSPRMVEDLVRGGLFQAHEAVCRISMADAAMPDHAIDTAAGRPPLYAVFLNYILDSLPATVLRFNGDRVERLYVRTRLSQRIRLADHTTLTVEQLVEAASGGSAGRQPLVDLYPLFSLDYAFRPAGPQDLPYIDAARKLASAENACVVHCYGAITALDRLLPALAPGGFILINDYTQAAAFPDSRPFQTPAPYQRYGGATAAGLNLDLLKHCFRREGCSWTEPDEDNDHLHSRLLARDPDTTTSRQFGSRFSKTLFQWTHEPLETAREMARQGRPEGSLALYRDAMLRQPRNWMLLDEVARYLIQSNEPATARQLAESALRLNPLSPGSWNTLGDALWAQGKVEEAHKAFLQALHVYPGDVRARHNLVYSFSRLGDFGSALQMIAEGLLLDQGGAYRDRLLDRQTEILSRLTRRAEIQSRILADRAFAAGGANQP
jgi:tetratricopeptide (TPR) repeat protein